MSYYVFEINKDTYSNLDNYIDNFTKINNIKTELLYGVRDNSKEYLITVIIPTYNRYELLKEALLSVLEQKSCAFSWEFIVIDNTPLDENGLTPALKLVREINDKRILYYHNTVNIGSGYNWNRGVELAQGKWITFLHDDDVLCKDALQNIGQLINKKRTVKKPLGYIHARSKKFTSTFSEGQLKFKNLGFSLELNRFTTLILGHTHTGMPSCGTTILREAYIGAGGINYDFGPTADAVLGYLIMKNYTVIRSGIILGGYRWSENETLKIATIKKLIEADYLFAKYRYKLTVFSRIWGKAFEKVQYVENIKVKTGLLRKFKDDYDVETEFMQVDVNIGWRMFYKLMTVLCKIGMCIKGMLLFRD